MKNFFPSHNSRILKLFAGFFSCGLVLAAVSIFCIYTASLSGCDIADTENCLDPEYPLYCESVGKCCPENMPYTDGHGSCYGTLDGCRASGYACAHCWEE